VRQQVRKCFRDYAIPPCKFLFSAGARHDDDADYLAHVEEKTRSDLVEMGFEPEQVYSLPGFVRDTSDYPARDSEFGLWNVDAESSEALQQVLLCEEYARIDVDGDGIAERVKVFRVE